MVERVKAKGVENTRILVTNDDGVYAPGIEVLKRIALTLSPDIWTVAPEHEKSGAGHSLTLHRPLRLNEVGPRKYAVNGTPTDCVLIATRHLLKDRLPDFVLSGVNYGSNLGDHISHSGTISAAMEAALLGVPAIALSLMLHESGEPHWDTAEHYAKDVICALIEHTWPKNVVINVNFPALPPELVKGIRLAHQGWRKVEETMTERLDPRGKPYYWLGGHATDETYEKGCDLRSVMDGYITITPLQLDLTHYDSLQKMRKTIEQDF